MVRAVLCIFLLLSGCYGRPAGSDVLRRSAYVDRIEIVVLESLPAGVTVVAHGHLPDSCTRLGDIEQTRDGAAFHVSIMTTRPADMMCATVIRTFERSIPLDVTGLPAGRYSVDVNDVQASFALP